MLFAYNILAIGLILLVLAVFKYHGQPTERHASYLRMAAFGVVPLLISLLGNNAVGVQRLMLGMGLSVLIAEISINRLTASGHSDRSKYLGWLPVIIPIGFILPYASYITYFFGYDRWLLIFAALVVIFYLWSPRVVDEKKKHLMHLGVAFMGGAMWAWLAFRYVMTFM